MVLLILRIIFFLKLVNKLIGIWIYLKEQDLGDDLKLISDSYISSFAYSYPETMSDYAENIWKYYLIENNDTYMFLTNQIFPSSLVAFNEKGIDKQYHVKCIKDVDFLINNYGLLYTILNKVPDFFLKPGLETICLIELCNFTEKHRNSKPQADLNMLFLMYIMPGTFKDNNLYSIDLFTYRKIIYDFEYYIRNRSNLPPGIDANYIIYMITNFYKYISHHTNDTNAIIMDLIELCKSPTHFLLESMKEICIDKKRIDLLISNKKLFLSFCYNAELHDISQSILDLIEGRNLEIMDTKLETNMKQVNKLESKTKKTENLVDNLSVKVTNQQENLTDLNKGIKNINFKLDEFGQVIEEHDSRIEEVNNKAVSNVPKWGKDICKLLGKDWILIAKRLNFNTKDIKAWSTQADPCMCMLQEWFITNKTSDAISGLIKCLKETNKKNCIKIIESSLDSADPNNNLDDSLLDTQLIENPPEVFFSFEWSSIEKALLLKKYLDGLKFINVWFDDGKMGGGTARNNRIDKGLRKCQVLICLITNEASKDETCLNQINLAVQLGKPIIPLLLDSKLKWPPSGSLGPILSEYLFIRFFQRPKEVTNDERYWPVEKFNELIMQLKCLIPSNNKTIQNDLFVSNTKSPEVFISYQWDKQPQIIKLFNKFRSIGINCWLDIYQMGGGDSLYLKIDRGLRNCLLVISCVTLKYSLSANCRKEIALADSISKPIIPILLESINYPPSGPMSPTLSVLKYIDFNKDLNEQETWNGASFKELLERMKSHLPKEIVENTTSKACILS